jgi:hypothetical protein
LQRLLFVSPSADVERLERPRSPPEPQVLSNKHSLQTLRRLTKRDSTHASTASPYHHPPPSNTHGLPGLSSVGEWAQVQTSALHPIVCTASLQCGWVQLCGGTAGKTRWTLGFCARLTRRTHCMHLPSTSHSRTQRFRLQRRAKTVAAKGALAHLGASLEGHRVDYVARLARHAYWCSLRHPTVRPEERAHHLHKRVGRCGRCGGVWCRRDHGGGCGGGNRRLDGRRPLRLHLHRPCSHTTRRGSEIPRV